MFAYLLFYKLLNIFYRFIKLMIIFSTVMTGWTSVVLLSDSTFNLEINKLLKKNCSIRAMTLYNSFNSLLTASLSSKIILSLFTRLARKHGRKQMKIYYKLRLDQRDSNSKLSNYNWVSIVISCKYITGTAVTYGSVSVFVFYSCHT